MPYGKVNPTGCAERYGLIQVRLDFCLESGDVRYDAPRFYVIDWDNAVPYTGKLDKEGQPVNQKDYDKWEVALPRVWQSERCFHSHFIYLDPYTLRDEQITDAIGLHLPNFYKAWIDEWDKVAGGMRHGWDVATRRPRPTRFNKTQPELYVARRAECLAKVDILKMSPFATQVSETGETFPATEIDVGSKASDRAAFITATATMIDSNNPSNGSGSLDTIEIWIYGISATDADVGTFYGSGTTYTSRDYAEIGAIVHGAKRTFTGLDIEIQTGDFIGEYGCYIETSTSGYDGCAYKAGNNMGAGKVGGYTWRDGDAISLYGTGETAAEPDIYAADTSRALAQVSIHPSDTARTSRQMQSYDADTLRALAQLQSLASDTFRQLCAMQSYAADTWRELVATLNDIYQADLLRTLQQAQGYPADALRPTTQAQQYAADTLRLLAALSIYAADTYRLIRQTQLSQWDTSRPIRGIQTFGADTVRSIHLDLYDRFTGDTRRIIWIPTPFIGPPFVVEVRNESGQLLGIPRVVFSGELTTMLNGPDALILTIAANDPVLQHLNSRSLLYVRDDDGNIISVCRPIIDERSNG